MTVRELVTKWGFQVEHAPLEKVEKQLEHIQGRLEFLATAEVLRGVVELTERFTQFAQEIRIAAMSAGLTVESFQKMAFAANLANVGADQLSFAMARLSRHIYGARQGSAEAQKAFAEAGFSQTQIQGFRTGQDVLLALADRFKGINDPIKKQAIAMQLLGRGSVQMVGFLSQGSAALRAQGVEAEKLGIILGEKQIAALTELEESMKTLFAVVKGLGATIASYFAPSLKTAIEQVIHFYEANRKLIDSNIREWVWDLTYAMGAVWAVIKFVGQALFDFAEKHPVLVRRISEVLFALGLFVGALFVAQKTVGILKGAIDLLGLAFAPLKFASKLGLGPIIWLGGLAQKAITGLILRLAVLVASSFPAVGEALLTLGAFIEATPVGWFITAIAALVVVLHDLYAVFFQGKSFKDTWIGQAFEFAKSAGGKLMDFFGFGAGDNGGINAKGVSESMDRVQAINTSTPEKISSSFGAGQAATAGGQNIIQAPVTFNIPAGTDHKMIYQSVKEGIREHLDRQNRETDRSLRPAQAY